VNALYLSMMTAAAMLLFARPGIYRIETEHADRSFFFPMKWA
jgi:hypothetical protein